MATNAQKFNVSKKIAQLTRVSFLFGSQLEERMYQKEYLNNLYKQKISEVLSDYTTKVTRLIEESKPEQNTLLSNYQNRYQKMYDQLLDENKQYQQQSINNFNEQCNTLSALISKLIPEFPIIIDTLSNNVSSFNTFSSKAKEDFKTKCEEIKKLHQLEVENHETESQQRLQQCAKEERIKIEKLRSEHEKNLQVIKSEGKTQKRNEEQIAQLQVKKDRLASISKVIYPAFEEAHKLARSYETFSKANKDVIFKYRALSEIIPKNTEIEKLKEDLEKQNIQYKDIEKKILDEIAATKASNEFKMNKYMKDVNNEIKQIEDQFQKDSSQYSTANSAIVAELNELTQKMKDEMEALKECISSKEKCCRQTEAQFEQEITVEKRNTKSAKAKKTKKLTKTKSDNQKAYESAQKYFNAIENDLKVKLESERNKFKKEIDDAVKGGSDALTNKQRELSKINLEKAAAEEAAISKIQNTVLNIQEKIKAQIESFKSLELMTENNLKNAFEKSQSDAENQINNAINNNKSIEKEFEHQINQEREAKIAKIRECGYDNFEYDSLHKEFTEQFKLLKNELDGILPPSPSGKFDTLEKDILSLESEINSLKEKIPKIKSQISKEFEDASNAEIARHKKTIEVKSSGRNKEQYIQSLQMQIAEIKKQIEDETSKLNKILTLNSENHQNNLYQHEIMKSKAEMTEEIKEFKQKLTNSINQQAQTIENLQGSAKIQIERFKQRITELQNEFDEKISNANKEHSNLRNNFKMELPHYQKELDNIKVNNETEYENESKNGQLRIERERTNQLQRTTAIKQKCDSIRQSIQNSNDIARRRLASSQSRRRDRADSASEEYQKMLEKMRADWRGMLAFYEESISVLRKKCEDLASNYDSRESRQCDVERIAELSSDLKQKTYYLKVLLQDFAGYKKLIIQQEKEYNKHFGVSPRIGTLTCGV